MNSPLLTLGLIFMISVPSAVTGQTPRISKCGGLLQLPVTRGNPCYIHCQVTDWLDADEIVIKKTGVTYYGLDSQSIINSKEVEYYNSNTGLNPGLPTKYTFTQRENEINISISATLPEDMGDFECWARKGNVVTKSEPVTLEVRTSSAIVEQHWERWDESGNVMERFVNGEEITIEYKDIENLAFRIYTSEPIYQASTVDLFDSGNNNIITAAFRKTIKTEPGDISGVGLIEGFSSTVTFSSPDIGHSSITGISLSAVVTFQCQAALGIILNGSTLRLNVQAPPQIQASSSCSKSFEEVRKGSTIVFSCGYASNPGQPLFALQLPGRNERIEFGDDRDFAFQVTKSANSATPYLYTLQITYRNIQNEVFGINRLYARNQMGESPSAYEFTVTSSGESAASKLGLSLLVPVISSLIAIASLASRF